MDSDLSAFKNRKNQKHALANLEPGKCVEICNHIWKVLFDLQTSLSFKDGLNVYSQIWRYKENVVKDRICKLGNLWLPDKKYINTSYAVELWIDDSVSVKKFCETVLKSDNFTKSSNEAKISYLDAMERLCYNFPTDFYESIRNFANDWFEVMFWSSRPSYIKGVGLNYVKELKPLIVFLLSNPHELQMATAQELLANYYEVNPKQFREQSRCLEWINGASKAIDLSFIKDLDKSISSEADFGVILSGIHRSFIFNSEWAFLRLNNILLKTDVVDSFISFALLVLNNKKFDFKDDYPFYEISRSGLKNAKTGCFVLSASLFNEMSDNDFIEKIQGLILFFIDYQTELNKLTKKEPLEALSIVISIRNTFELKNELSEYINNIPDNGEEVDSNFKL